MAVVGVLAAITGLSGVSAAASAGGARPSFAQSAVAWPASASPTTTTTTVEEPAPVATPSTTTSSSVPPPSTTTTVPCHNSSDPECGPFRWSTDPGPNAPLTVDIKYSPADPHPGDVVTFTVTATDPDASHFPQMCDDYGDHIGNGCISGVTFDDDPYCAPMYGPWDPPPRKLGEESLGNPPGTGVTHIYTAPGTYTVTFSFGSAATMCRFAGPYASRGTGTVTVSVRPADTTTTTTR